MSIKHKLAKLKTMGVNKQSQNAGDGAVQTQVDTIINNYNTTVGIDESRAREICREELKAACKELTIEAEKTAIARSRKLEELVMPKFIDYDKSLIFFADPTFQIMLREAMLTAACSDRESDYEILSQLLLHRIKNKGDMDKSASVRRAIRITNEISDMALVALSIVYAVSKYIPNSCGLQLHQSLNILDNLYTKILSGVNLPTDEKWMEHLDILQTIRIGEGFSKFKKMKEYAPTLFPQVFVSGIECDTDELNNIKREFEKCGLSTNCMVPHPLKPNCLILNLPNDVEKIVIHTAYGEQKTETKPNSKQKEVLKKALSTFNKDESQNNILQDSLMREWNKFPTLNTIAKWWDGLSQNFRITPIGEAIADAYIHGKEPSMPTTYL